MIFHVLLILSVLISATVTAKVGATAAYTPTDVFLFNCGAISHAEDDNGRDWTVENGKIMPLNSVNASFSSDVLNQGSVPRVPYMQARIFRSAFTYNFPVSPGWKFLRLYFYPTSYGSGFDAINSSFSVTVNDFTLLKKFSDLAKAYYSGYFIKEFVVPGSDGHTTLNLTFTPSPNLLGFINGIEIVSMPDRFYSKGGFDNRIGNVGSSSTIDYQIDNSTVLETVHRLNVGGRMVSDVDDSGMFRKWLSDYEFMLGEDQGIIRIRVPDVKINYTAKTPAYVAPEYVYTTSRGMGNTNNPKLNLLFKIDPGFNYLVRLHFCETLLEVTQIGQRVFSIFIGNKTAKTSTDVIFLSGGHRIPIYLDFNIYMGQESGPNLRLDLHPSITDNPMYFDVSLNGVEILKLNDHEGSLARPNPDSNPNPVILGGNLHVRVITILLIVVGSPIGLMIFIVFFMLLMRQMKRKKHRKENSVVMSKVLLKHYTYAEVKKITKSFSQTVGKGGFGTVYGGSLCNGRKVAIKVLKDSRGNGEDFINEVTSMSQTSHVNIVSLLGFCYEGSKRAIVYEFLENGSLDQFISRHKSSTLDATTLYGIALGIARGLEYLHYGCKTRIVHFDIKPENILLDENLCPKVSDFGLAKLCEKRESIVSLINTRGTIGYIAPEVFSGMYGRISHKSDVYSYGMLVLEMTGARNKESLETHMSHASSTYFPDWIYKTFENGEQTWISGDEVTTKEDEEITKKMVMVALWCIQSCPSNRPSMNRVVEMMEGNLDALEIPPKPSMHISTEIIVESSSLSSDTNFE